MPELSTVMLALIAAVPGLYAAYATYRKNRTDAVGTLTNSALSLVGGIETRLKAIELELAQAREQIEALSFDLDTERKKRRELELRVEQLEDEKAGLISENGHLQAQLTKHLEAIRKATP